jgi:DNA-binding MarR family transcriptional regulator
LAQQEYGAETFCGARVLPVELSPSQALGLWHTVTLSQVCADAHDLTQRQMAIFLHIYLAPPPHTVRGLAATLKVTKPVITRALDTMGAMGLVDRVRDDKDRRNVIIKRTVAGAIYLEKLGDMIIAEGRKLPL